MRISLFSFKIGFIAFMIVLLLMPIGHVVMILNEILLEEHKFTGAFLIGLLGLMFLVIGIIQNQHRITATVLGLVSGVLVWTGWIEFSFVWIAEKLKIAPLIEEGVIVTKPEYLVMMSSLGLLMTFLVFYLFLKTNCTYFSWFQKHLGLKKYINTKGGVQRPLALITFIESIMLMWMFYLVLLLVYDKEISQYSHIATSVVAIGSLIWSLYLIFKLLRITKLDYAIRYAIPTVIIFWNVVEILGRWDFLKEVWVFPAEHTIENILIVLTLVGVALYYRHVRKKKGSFYRQKDN